MSNEAVDWNAIQDQERERQEVERLYEERRDRELYEMKQREAEKERQRKVNNEEARRQREQSLKTSTKDLPKENTHIVPGDDGSDVGSPEGDEVPIANQVKFGGVQRIAGIGAHAVALGLASVSLIVALGASDATSQLRTDIALAMDNVDDSLSVLSASVEQLSNRSELFATSLGDIRGMISALGVDDLREQMDGLRGEFSGMETELAAASENSQEIANLKQANATYNATLTTLQDQINEQTKTIKSWRASAASKSTASRTPAASPTVVLDIDGVSLMQIDRWAGEQQAVLRDQDGKFMTLSAGERLGDWTLTELLGNANIARFEQDGVVMLLEQKRGA